MAEPDPRSAWSITGTVTGPGSTSLTSAQAAGTNMQYAITNISASSDVTGNFVIYDGTVAGTKKWQIKVAAGTPFSTQFPTDAPLLVTPGNAVTAQIDSGSLAVSMNVSGYRIANG